MFNLIKDLITGNISVVKLGIILSILTTLTGVCYWAYDSIYDAGFNSAKVEYLEEAELGRRALEKEYMDRILSLKGQLDSTNTSLITARDKASELQFILDNRPVIEVVREIESINTDDCTSLDDEYNRVLHNIIGEPPTIPSTSKPVN